MNNGEKMSASLRAHRASFFFLLLFVLSLFLLAAVIEVTEAQKRAVSIPDDLDDVVDDEEDDAWRDWGQKKNKKTSSGDFKPPDFTKMSPAEIQAEMMKQHVGPSYGFVKLRLGVSRTKEEIPMIAMRWSKVLRTGAVEVKFMAVDLSTIMFTIERGQDIEELKEFILNQPEAYEIKIGEQVYRRPGDPPLEEVIEMLRKERSGYGSSGSTENAQHPNDEL